MYDPEHHCAIQIYSNQDHKMQRGVSTYKAIERSWIVHELPAEASSAKAFHAPQAHRPQEALLQQSWGQC